MWRPTSPAGTLSRPRLAIVAVAAMAAVAVGYLTYEYRLGTSRGRGSPGRGLRRRNALRRARSPPDDDGGGGSETSEETAGDDHVDIHLRGHERSSGNGNNIHDDDRVDTNNASVVATTSVDVDALIHAGSDGWWNNQTAYQPPTRRTGQNIVSLLFRVSEDHARRSSYVHRGCQCNICGAVPIRGIRYRCTNCADFDLCETCEAQGIHNRTHIFYKIKMPIPPYSSRHMQPVWYTGDPDNCRRSLPRSLIVKLSRETGLDLTEVEAFWEQWTFMAVSEWKDDPDEVGVAMDRKTFDRCLVPTGGSRYAAPNLIHDRMFAFYDTNNDGLITFSEFLHGLAYRKRKDKLRKIFDGYDIDNDGYVSRRDFLRMFRAYYVIYKQMHKDIVDLMDGQLRASTEAASLVYSRQPLSSFFGRDDNVPPSNASMQFQGKTFHADGTVHLDDAHRGATAENSGDTASREDILTRFFAYGTRQDPPHRGRAVEGDTSSIRHAVRLPFGSDADRAYWSTLLHPPATLDDLARALVGDRSQETGASDDDSDDEIQPGPGDDRRPQYQSNSTARPWRTESELQAKMLEETRLKAAELERQRRAMARDELHMRWKKRMFYLDEEEGGQPPDDWNHDDDYLAKHYGATEKAQSASYSTAAPTRSRSSSKVRFAGDVDDCETRSNLPTSSRSVPERWGGMDIPDAEREAGKEILYQVTQQAFNELLDTIFKASEDLAYEAGMTKKLRDDAKAALDALEAEDIKEDEVQASPGCKAEGLSFGVGQPPETAKSGGSANLPDGTVQPESATDGDGPAQYRDLTMPQFRPNSIHSTRRSTLSDGDAPYPSQGTSPPIATLRWWQVLAQAEATAEERTGWGRLSYDEFEVIYRFQERQGNRLDFLGSWIDFCIP